MSVAWLVYVYSIIFNYTSCVDSLPLTFSQFVINILQILKIPPNNDRVGFVWGKEVLETEKSVSIYLMDADL